MELQDVYLVDIVCHNRIAIYVDKLGELSQIPNIELCVFALRPMVVGFIHIRGPIATRGVFSGGRVIRGAMRGRGDDRNFQHRRKIPLQALFSSSTDSRTHNYMKRIPAIMPFR
jgi:hypothetical protein